MELSAILLRRVIARATDPLRGRGRAMIIAGFIIVLAIVAIAAAAPLLTPHDPTKAAGDPLQPPNMKHPMGTDRLGRDMWSRVAYGARIILSIVATGTLVSMAVGIPLGMASAYLGGRIDRFMSMVMDAIYAFPSLVLAIALAVALGPSMINAAIAIAIVYVPTYYRMIRGQVLSVKEELFIEMARVLGLRRRQILFKHIFPHLLPTIAIVFSLNAADAVLTEAALSFLGLSVQPPTPDWGYDLQSGRGIALSGYWWLVFFPGLMITILALGFALIGEGLGEKARRESI